MGPAVLALIITLVTGHLDWIVLIGVYLLLGVLLDTAVYSWLLKYQPPWMTFVLGLAEYGFLLAVTQLARGLPEHHGARGDDLLLGLLVPGGRHQDRAAADPLADLPRVGRRVPPGSSGPCPPQQVALPVLASAAEAGADPARSCVRPRASAPGPSSRSRRPPASHPPPRAARKECGL